MAEAHKNSLNYRIFARSTLLIMVLWMSVASAHGSAGEITGVEGGDSLVAVVEGETRRIRLYGIDAPVSGQHGSNAAQRYLRNLALEHPVEIDIIETDSHDRAVAIVRRVKKESSINAAIVANGYAWVNPKTCTATVCRKWKALERQASRYRLGIWSGFDLVPPWEYNIQEGP